MLTSLFNGLGPVLRSPTRLEKDSLPQESIGKDTSLPNNRNLSTFQTQKSSRHTFFPPSAIHSA